MTRGTLNLLNNIFKAGGWSSGWVKNDVHTCDENVHSKNKWCFVSGDKRQSRQPLGMFKPHPLNRSRVCSLSRRTIQLINTCLGILSLNQIVLYHDTEAEDGGLREFHILDVENKQVHLPIHSSIKRNPLPNQNQSELVKEDALAREPLLGGTPLEGTKVHLRRFVKLLPKNESQWLEDHFRPLGQ